MLELAAACASTLCSPDVGLYDEISHAFCGPTMGDIGEDLVEIFELICPSFVGNNSAVLSQHSEIKRLINAGDGYEGRFTRGRRQLLEVPK